MSMARIPFVLDAFSILYHFNLLNTRPFWSFLQENRGWICHFLYVPLKKTNVPAWGTFFHAKCLTYAPHGARIGKTKAHRTIASASLSRLFVPLPQFRKWEIHTVFLHFRNFELEQKSCLRLLAELCGAALRPQENPALTCFGSSNRGSQSTILNRVVPAWVPECPPAKVSKC